MRLLRGPVLIMLLLVTFLASACDITVDNSNTTEPTPIVITSTPTTSPGENDKPTSTPDSKPGTQPEAIPSAAATATATTGAESTATAVPTSETSNDARTEIEAIEADVETLRGLDLTQDLDEQIINREELARRVEVILEQDYSPEEAQVDALSYWLLRLIPDRNLDLYQLQVDLLSEQIAGYYDPDTKELVVVTEDGTLAVVDKVTMAHEIVHALQDQHFDLNAIDDLAIDADHNAAITALIEGDATLSMTDYMLNYLDPMELLELFGDNFTGSDSSVLDNAPLYISEGLLFSYDAGQTFNTALFDEGGYDAINAAFADPPSSTEQILHPEKYLAANRDEPMLVDNPDISGTLGAGWDLLRGDVLGEWDLKIMLEDNGISSSEAEAAAAGWGGSWFDIYESGDKSLALLTTRWDSDSEASEFADSLLKSFSGDATNGGLWADSDRFFSVIAAGDTVVMISGTDEGDVALVQSEIEQTI